MVTIAENPKDLCTDAIPEPPRDQQTQKAKSWIPKCDDAIPEPPRDQKKHKADSRILDQEAQSPEEDANRGHDSDEELKQDSHKKNYRDEPNNGFSEGFSNFPNGSIIISHSQGPIQIGNNFWQNIFPNSYPTNQNMRPRPPRIIPETDQIRAMFERQELVTEKDLRYVKKYISIPNFNDTASELDIEDERIERHRYDPNNYQIPEEIIYKVLREWMQNRCEKDHGYDPTIGKLARALWDTGSQLAVYKWAKVLDKAMH